MILYDFGSIYYNQNVIDHTLELIFLLSRSILYESSVQLRTIMINL
jgi:hypothetical protein